MSATGALIPQSSPSPGLKPRLTRMSQELAHAWDHTNHDILAKWAASVAGDFVGSLGRRVRNIGKFGGRVVAFNVDEASAARKAYDQGRLSEHVRERGTAAWEFLQGLFTKSRDAGDDLVASLRNDPRTVAPHLLAMVVTSLVVSGGTDGDGGAPDLDLLGGIGAHRSVWTHSILMGATLETGFLALVRLVQHVHENLPAEHDPKWDELAFHAQSILSAANKGASIGLAYHYLMDGLVQPGTYHGIPFEMPQEAHEVIQVLNGATEGIDARHKDWLATAPVWVRNGARNWPWAQPGYVPAKSKDPAAHRAERRLRFHIDGETQEFLTPKQISGVQKYGTWMEGLTSGRLAPLTPEQERFVRVAWGLTPPTTEFERTWTMYLTGQYGRG